jgi:hypothetical protein
MRGLANCPAGDLHVPSQLSRMLAARASSDRDVVFTVLGSAGSGPVTEVLRYNEALHASLTRLGVPHHLTVVPHFGGSNVCSEQLLPRGSCCGWSSVGRPQNASATARLAAKGLALHRSVMLFVQRWWFLAAATRAGYNVMSLDADLRITRDPVQMVRSASLGSFGLLFSGDFGFPELTGRTGAAHRDHVPVRCDAPRPNGPTCECGVTATPGVNTGFVWARAEPGAQIFLARVLARLLALLDRGGAARPPRRKVDRQLAGSRTFDQSVVNEQLYQLARGDDGSTGCHPLDHCKQPSSRRVAGGVARAWDWWAQPPRPRSVWSAATLRIDDDDEAVTAARCRSAIAGGAELLAHTHLSNRTRAAVLPRSRVSRLCGARAFLYRHVGNTTPPLSCDAPHYQREAPVLDAAVAHMMAAAGDVKAHAWSALRWWATSPSVRVGTNTQPQCAPTRRTSRAVALGTSAASDRTLLCVDALPRSPCPCCWERGFTGRPNSHVDSMLGCARWHW